MGSYEVDDSRHPLVVVRFQGALTDDQFVRYLEELTANLERDEKDGAKSIVVLDAQRAGHTPASQRSMQAEWIRANSERLRAHRLGTVFVIQSQVIRGILTAVFWLQPLPTPYAIVASEGEAIRWARERFQAHGIELPPFRANAAS